MAEAEKIALPPVSDSVNLAGINLFLPFLEKLLLYQTFFKKDLLWTRNKSQYWKHEKFILLWAWSEGHQHLGRALTTKRLLEIYGIRVVNGDWRVISKPQVKSKNSSSLVSEMLENRGSMLEPIMGNLEIKGLAGKFTYGEVAEAFIKTRKENLEKSAQRIIESGLTQVVQSIIVNRRGLLVGELVFKEEHGQFWKYKAFIAIIKLVVLVVLISALLLAINNLFGLELHLPIVGPFNHWYYLAIVSLVFLCLFFRE